MLLFLRRVQIFLLTYVLACLLDAVSTSYRYEFARSLQVQLIAWKDLSPQWSSMCRDAKVYLLLYKYDQ